MVLLLQAQEREQGQGQGQQQKQGRALLLRSAAREETLARRVRWQQLALQRRRWAGALQQQHSQPWGEQTVQKQQDCWKPCVP